ncbi:hypothetical protein C8R48DRAFT_674534 [Suillus tomentosus]|nr:hypothetical protein C8R48DRAFT_674534 [Suillus tomentosus]
MRAPYAPPAIRQWVQAQQNQPQSHDIDCQRFANRRGIRHDKENLSTNKCLHEHFCLNKDDRELAFHEGMSDIKDAATGMGRIADVLFIGFGLRPEWDPNRPLRASDVEVDVVTSRQFEQLPHFKRITSKLRDVFVQELGVAHIWSFREKLNQVTPGLGYVLDPLTRQLMTGNIQLANGQSVPNLSSSTLAATPQHLPHSQTSNLTQSASVSRSQPATTQSASVSRSQPSTVSPRCIVSPSRPYPPAPTTSTQYRAPRVIFVDSDLSSESEFDPESDGSDRLSPLTRQFMPARQPVITPPLDQLTAASARSFSSTHRSLASTHRSTNAREPSSTHTSARRSTNFREPSSTHQAATTARIAQQSAIPRPSWIVTPPGSPSIAVTGDAPPPAYYINPDVSFFNFMPPVREFLCRRRASAAMLCKVDATLDYGMDCWVTCFQEAGLSFEDASTLRALIVQSLSDADLQVVLAAGSI